MAYFKTKAGAKKSAVALQKIVGSKWKINLHKTYDGDLWDYELVLGKINHFPDSSSVGEIELFYSYGAKSDRHFDNLPKGALKKLCCQVRNGYPVVYDTDPLKVVEKFRDFSKASLSVRQRTFDLISEAI